MTYSPNANPNILHAQDVIFDTYGDVVSVKNKKKNLLRFGARTTVGTGWETLMTAQGSETDETFVTTNAITTIVSSDSDTGTINIEYHTIADGETTFGVQGVTLTGTTPVTLDTACFRISRMYNTGSAALVGNIYAYEGGTRTDANTHAVIPAGEQQTQKGQTTVSSNDYWIITNLSVSVLAKTTKYVEARLEIKPVAATYWRPLSQTFATTDSAGTIKLDKEPYLIVPSNHDVRLAVRTNTSSVDVAGGFNGYLAN